MPHSEHQPTGDYCPKVVTLDEAQSILGTVNRGGAYNRLRDYGVHPIEHSPIRYYRDDVVRVARLAPASLTRSSKRQRTTRR